MDEPRPFPIRCPECDEPVTVEQIKESRVIDTSAHDASLAQREERLATYGWFRIEPVVFVGWDFPCGHKIRGLELTLTTAYLDQPAGWFWAGGYV